MKSGNNKAVEKRDATFWKVLNAALELDFKKGHLKWTMSDLSRRSGITRSLIYYYFGRSKSSILEAAVRVIGEEFVGVGPSRLDMWKQDEMVKSLKATRKLAKDSPFICQFYLNHREKPTEIGESLRRLENEHLKKLAVFFPNASEIDQRALFTVFFGTSFSPFSDDPVIERLAESIKRLMSSAS